MELQTIVYDTARGWHAPLPGHLDSPATLLLAFGGRECAADSRPFDDIAAAFPQAVIAGCSTSGEICAGEVGDDTITLAVCRFAYTSLRFASAPIASAEASYEAGQQLAAALSATGLRAVFVLSDGLNVNGTRLVEGINSALPAQVVVTGGLAGDGDRFAQTWVLEHGRPKSGTVTAVGFYGERLRVGHGFDAGWSSFGPERRVTRSSGNVLYELDGKPALALYKEYLGERAHGLPATGLLFPLAIRRDADSDEQLIRTILAVDEQSQSLTFAGDIPQGCRARLMRANSEQLIQSAGNAAAQACGQMPAGFAPLVVAVSCVGRRLILGERSEEEVEAVLDVLPATARQVGFYSYGEISPLIGGGASDLHNQTMTITVFAED